VSEVIGKMSFLWLPVDDEPGPNSQRGYIERNVIALLSNYEREPLDPPSENWLGRHSDRERVRESGLWNQNHVDEACDLSLLSMLSLEKAHAYFCWNQQRPIAETAPGFCNRIKPGF